MPEHVHLLVMPREEGLKVGKFAAGWYAGLTPVALEMDRTLPMFYHKE
jgi:hypothetical protein